MDSGSPQQHRPVKLALTFCAVVLLATACNRQEASGDAQIRKLLPGVWKLESPEQSENPSKINLAFNSAITVGPDLSYVCTLTIPARTNGPRMVHMEGSWEVRDGALIDTITKHSQTNAPVPMVSTGLVVRIDERELVVTDDPQPGASVTTNLTVFRRQTK